MMADGDINFTHQELDPFLSNYFAYYNTLERYWQIVFVDRVICFAKSKLFIAQKNCIVDNRVKTIISASAVQLTLGLKEWHLSYFDTIIVFPDDFKNAITGLNLKGETNLTGFVSFSWKSFVEGYRIPNDNLNLGLHEFTHALRFNGIRGENTDYFFDNYFEKWYCYARKEFYNLQKGLPSFLRQYGGANINEFLSVSIEHFFESPQQFKNNAPELYAATAILLNQKTDGQQTEVGIRQKELNALKDKAPLSEFTPEKNFFNSPGVLSSYVFVLIGAFTIWKTGLFSFPTLFVFLLYGLLMLKNDFSYGFFNVDATGIDVYKGFLAFKNRKRRRISLNELVNVEIFTDDGNEHTVIFNYFTNNELFYTESANVRMNEDLKTRFINELRKNFVWVKEPKINRLKALT